MPLTADITAKIEFNQTNTADFGPGRFQGMAQAILNLTSGTGLGQADVLFADERTVASATNDDLDLAGVLSSALGATIAMAELVGILIINKPATKGLPDNTTNLTVGGGTNPVTPAFMGGTTPTFGPIRPGGFLFFACPDAAGFGVVTAATADILRIANSSGAQAIYQIVVIGRSA